MNGPWITRSGSVSSSAIAEIANASFEAALHGFGKMKPEIYLVSGFCGRKFRLFLNNLIEKVENPRYLEIGVFGGATLCAAIEGNSVKAVGVDDWSWGPRDNNQVIQGFYKSLALFKPKICSLTIVESDFHSVPYEALGPFNVMFYDGPHSEQDQYDGVRIPFPALDERSVILIDDWNWIKVRDGTMRALNEAGATIEFSVELRTSQMDEGEPSTIIPGGIAGSASDWHNGCFVGVIKKAE
jgi:hypothetical protein